MKNCSKNNSREISSWEFKKDFEKCCIQNILAKVTSVVMLIDSEDVCEEEMDVLERCATLAITLTDQIKYLDSETTIVQNSDEE